MNIARTLLIAIAVMFLGAAAIRAEDPPASQPAAKQLTDFRKLKELMPDTLAGVPRSSNQGEKVAIGEFNLSKAEAEYQRADPGENDPQIRVEIIDYVGAGPMAAGMAAWQNIQIDKESDGGYEKTSKVKEQPAYEKYETAGKSGEIQIFVAGRFIVSLHTTNLTAEQMKQAAEALPIEKLAQMK